MKIRSGIFAALLVLLLPVALPASAQVDGEGGTGPVTAVLDSVGVRSITSVSALVLTGALSVVPTDDYAVVVTEAARTGTNSWSVTGRMCGSVDCSTDPDALVLTTNSAVSLAGDAIDVSNRAVTELVPGGSGTLAAPGTTEVFSQARTLFTNNDQSTTTIYSEVYTATGDVSVTPPDGTAAGTYAGFFVVTLV